MNCKGSNNKVNWTTLNRRKGIGEGMIFKIWRLKVSKDEVVENIIFILEMTVQLTVSRQSFDKKDSRECARHDDPREVEGRDKGLGGRLKEVYRMYLNATIVSFMSIVYCLCTRDGAEDHRCPDYRNSEAGASIYWTCQSDYDASAGSKLQGQQSGVEDHMNLSMVLPHCTCCIEVRMCGVKVTSHKGNGAERKVTWTWAWCFRTVHLMLHWSADVRSQSHKGNGAERKVTWTWAWCFRTVHATLKCGCAESKSQGQWCGAEDHMNLSTVLPHYTRLCTSTLQCNVYSAEAPCSGSCDLPLHHCTCDFDSAHPHFNVACTVWKHYAQVHVIFRSTPLPLWLWLRTSALQCSMYSAEAPHSDLPLHSIAALNYF